MARERSRSTKAVWISAVALALGLLAGWPHPAQATPGDLDSSFGGDGKVTTDFGSGEDGAADVAIQPDGKIVVAGLDSDDGEVVLARYDEDGGLDTSFGGGDGIATTDLLNYGVIALALDGSIMVGSGNGDFVLARFTSAGALDTGFGGGDGMVEADLGGNDYANDVLRQSDGKFVLGGEGGASGDFALARFGADGSLDPSFGGGDGRVTTDFGDADVMGGAVLGESDRTTGLAIGTDGRIVAAGATGFGGAPANEYDFAVARYQPDGALDTGFSGDGRATLGFAGFDYASAAAVQPNGKVVVAGTGVLAGKMHVTLLRYSTSGTLDPTFGDGDGIVTNDLGPFGSGASDVALQADGRIVISGSGGDAAEDSLVARYDPSGSLDPTFGGDGSVATDFNGDSDWAWALALQAGGKIVTVGATRKPGSFDDEFAIARFLGGGAPPVGEEESEPPKDPPSPPPASPPLVTTGPASGTAATPPPRPPAKSLKCKRGFRKRRVRGKARCVKVKRPARRGSRRTVHHPASSGR